ncbi:MAG: hypothetical protein JWR56_1289 [Massilia sp.]|nr:hypothetical protein [Massilia sp.]
MPFETNVFINCPFDPEFKKILRPILFTIIYHGLKPRIATERIDSGEARISKIIQLIKESKYSIHDLSRVRSTEVGEMFRLNMPYELGIDVGCREFGRGKLGEKKFLITAAEQFEYQKALSDIAGSDISVHNDDAQQTVRIVRQWIENQIGGEDGSQKIWTAYEDFNASIYDKMVESGFDEHEIENVHTAKLIKQMEDWIRVHKLKKALSDDLAKAARGSHSFTSGSLKITIKPPVSTSLHSKAQEELNARTRAATSSGK